MDRENGPWNESRKWSKGRIGRIFTNQRDVRYLITEFDNSWAVEMFHEQGEFFFGIYLDLFLLFLFIFRRQEPEWSWEVFNLVSAPVFLTPKETASPTSSARLHSIVSTTMSNASTAYHLNVHVAPKDIQALKQSGYKMYIAKKCNNMYNVVWAGQRQVFHTSSSLNVCLMGLQLLAEQRLHLGQQISCFCHRHNRWRGGSEDECLFYGRYYSR